MNIDELLLANYKREGQYLIHMKLALMSILDSYLPLKVLLKQLYSKKCTYDE